MTLKQDGAGAATVDAATPRSTKLQLIVKADGVAQYGQYQPGSGWTHWAPLPAFGNDKGES